MKCKDGLESLIASPIHINKVPQNSLILVNSFFKDIKSGKGSVYANLL